jgi:PqqD family protein of HPr-rel-A system
MADQDLPVTPTSCAHRRLKFVDLADGTAVYDRASGSTHVVDPISAAVLQMLQEQGSTIDSVSASSAVVDRLGLQQEEWGPAALEDCLDRLRKAGLA